ncbi:hypothetical protein HKK55_19575 [Pseudomonas sp. ADAK18]|nr:hypothetical protein HKK55_19575 [Pseudomonas sp. ADAK18]
MRATLKISERILVKLSHQAQRYALSASAVGMAMLRPSLRILLRVCW